MANTKIHPVVDDGVKQGKPGFAGDTLVCKCATDQVEVTVDNEFLFNHMCGCTKCWKPEDATFSMLAAVPREKVKVTKHEEKLKIVNRDAVLHRYACTGCDAHCTTWSRIRSMCSTASPSSTRNCLGRQDMHRQHSRPSYRP